MASRQRLRLRGAAAAAAAAPAPAVAPPQPAVSLVLGTLPAELALCVLLRLPLKERVAAEAVCRGWRAALRAPELWARLDLSPLGGRVGDDLALALAARAGAGLRSLDVSNCSQVTVDALLRCAAAVGEHPDAQLAVRAPASWWSAKQARRPRSTQRGAHAARLRHFSCMGLLRAAQKRRLGNPSPSECERMFDAALRRSTTR